MYVSSMHITHTTCIGREFNSQVLSSLGTFPQLVVTILKAIASTKDAADVVDWVFIALLPNYNMGVGVSNLYTNYQYQDLCYTQLPEALNRTAGKASLENYCANLTTPFPCCKGECNIVGSIDHLSYSEITTYMLSMYII